MINQPGLLSLPSLRGREMSSNPCNYMDHGGGDHLTADMRCVWMFGRRSKSRDRELSLQPIGCTPALSVTQPRRCSCICRLWRYINVMPLPFIQHFVTAIIVVGCMDSKNNDSAHLKTDLFPIFYSYWQTDDYGRSTFLNATRAMLRRLMNRRVYYN